MIKSAVSIMEVAVKKSAAYKVKLLFYSLTGVMQFIIYYSIWNTMTDTDDSLLTYFVLSFTIQSLIPRWITMDIGWSVKKGDIVNTFFYPVSFRVFYFFQSIGDVLFTFLFMGTPVLMIACIKKALIPCHHIVGFTFSLLLSYGIAFYLFYFIGLMSFRLTSIWGVFLAFDLVYLFLSGAYIPIRFMPVWMQQLVFILPFRYIIDLPISMWESETIPFGALGMQCVWLLLLFIVTTIMYSKETKRLDIFGG